MNPLAKARGKAYAFDCVTYLGVAAATVPLGLLLQDSQWVETRNGVLALSTIPPIIAAILAARQESGVRRATWGKRRQRLVVETEDGSKAGFGRTLLRNTLKIAIPWQIGHTVAVGAAFGGFEEGDPATLVASGMTYIVLGVLIAGVFIGEGRAIHDRLSGTRVVDEP